MILPLREGMIFEKFTSAKFCEDITLAKIYKLTLTSYVRQFKMQIL